MTFFELWSTVSAEDQAKRLGFYLVSVAWMWSYSHICAGLMPDLRSAMKWLPVVVLAPYAVGFVGLGLYDLVVAFFRLLS